MLMRILKQYAGRRVSFLVAEKSIHEPFVGPLALNAGALPVVRAMDKVKPGPGQIFLPSPTDDSCLVHGRDVDFTISCMEGGTIILPRVGKVTPEQQSIAEILGPTALRLRKPFKEFPADHALHKALRIGTDYKIAPHIDQTEMFNAVYQELESGGCIGIFPEGGSHDQPSLLPLKAGAAIIALGTLARSPDCGLSIVPCGLNYFAPNKFRSRAVIEFGAPVKASREQIEAFKLGGESKRDAVGSLLATIQDALGSVTQQAQDRELLMLIRTTRRLYQPLQMKLPLPLITEINRRLIKGYTRYKDRPQVVQLEKEVKAYHRQLQTLGVRDHQVEWGNARLRPWWLVLGTLLYRIGELLILSIGTLPSVVLFWPVFLAARVISHRKQRKALANSVVKLEAKDVVGSWKILVAMGLAPALYIWYTLVVTLWLYYIRQGGYYTSRVPWYMNARNFVPDYVPLWVFATSFFPLMVAVSFAGLRIGEVGVDILQSLPPLFVALSPRSSAALADLRVQRQVLADHVTETINDFRLEIYPLVDRGKRSRRDDFEEQEEDVLEPTYTSHLSTTIPSATQGDADRELDMYLTPSPMPRDNINPFMTGLAKSTGLEDHTGNQASNTEAPRARVHARRDVELE